MPVIRLAIEFVWLIAVAIIVAATQGIQCGPGALEAAEYRALVRAQMIDPNLDVAGDFPLADVMSATALTGIDDHSRMCVCAKVMTASGSGRCAMGCVRHRRWRESWARGSLNRMHRVDKESRCSTPELPSQLRPSYSDRSTES
jgi:hypothetical protein